MLTSRQTNEQKDRLGPGVSRACLCTVKWLQSAQQGWEMSVVPHTGKKLDVSQSGRGWEEAIGTCELLKGGGCC